MKITDRQFLSVPTFTCHASTIAFYKDYPVFAWFGGSREGLPDSSIYVQYKDKIKSLGKNIKKAHWNPILFNIGEELFLAYKVGEFCDRWTTFLINITDIENIDDLNTVPKQLIPAGLNFAVKTKPIMNKHKDFIYCGSSVETREDWSSYIEIYTYENGKFIFKERSRPLTVEKQQYEYKHSFYGQVKAITQGIIQPSLWRDKNGVYNAFFRSSKGLGKIYHSYNNMDSVSTYWLDPLPTKLDNPNSGIDTVYFNDRLFLVNNPNDTYRYPLVIHELNDKFEIINEIVIREKVDKTDCSPELSYPYMIEHNGKLHLTYTYGRKKIEYGVIEI